MSAGENCCTQVSGVCNVFLKVLCISNKLDPHHLRGLVQLHQIFQTPHKLDSKLVQVFKLGSQRNNIFFLQKQQLYSGVAKNCISQPFLT